jgi:hypothetical protein
MLILWKLLDLNVVLQLVDVFQVDQPALNVTKQQDSANARKLLLAPSVTLALMVSSALQQVVKVSIMISHYTPIFIE